MILLVFSNLDESATFAGMLRDGGIEIEITAGHTVKAALSHLKSGNVSILICQIQFNSPFDPYGRSGLEIVRKAKELGIPAIGISSSCISKQEIIQAGASLVLHTTPEDLAKLPQSVMELLALE